MAGMQRFAPVEALFKGRHFDGQIIILCVSWYTSFKLSLRDLVIMMADRGITLTHTTILRWVQRYLPEFEKRWSRYARTVGGSWRMDETYIKVGGRMGLPVSGCGQGRPDGRFLSEPHPRRERGQGLSPQCDEEHAHTVENYAGRLCGIASRRKRVNFPQE
jgi:hypothetical protein